MSAKFRGRGSFNIGEGKRNADGREHLSVAGIDAMLYFARSYPRGA